MKIKMMTKYIILAVAIMSIVGVGAVSFALWQGAAPSMTASAHMGEVTLIGFKTDAGLDLSGTLVPMDQGAVTGNNTTMLNGLLNAYEATADITLTVTYTQDSDTLAEGSTLYVLIDKNTTAELPTADTLNAKGWKAVGATATFDFEIAEYTDAQDLYVHVILDSNAGADMNKTLNLLIELAEKAA